MFDSYLTFLAYDVLGLSCKSSPPGLESAISPKLPGSFQWGMLFR